MARALVIKVKLLNRCPNGLPSQRVLLFPIELAVNSLTEAVENVQYKHGTFAIADEKILFYIVQSYVFSQSFCLYLD